MYKETAHYEYKSIPLCKHGIMRERSHAAHLYEHSQLIKKSREKYCFILKKRRDLFFWFMATEFWILDSVWFFLIPHSYLMSAVVVR